MQTYYQKHRQIKAFQFNGTLKQLRDELPGVQLMHLIQSQWLSMSDTQLNQHHYIQTLINNDQTMNWPKITIKHHGIFHYQNLIEPNMSTPRNVWSLKHAERSWSQPTNRLVTPRDLNYGDYVIVDHYMARLIEIDDHHRLYHYYAWFNRLKIQSPQNFESHWSKTPIKNI